MVRNKLYLVGALALVALLMFAACAPAAVQPTAAPPTAASAQPTAAAAEPTAAQPTAAPAQPTAADSGFQIPEVEEGKYNVAFVYIGPHDDAGWTQAHDEGRLYVEETMPDVHTAYVELVPEGAESEQVIRGLAR
jgi:basic membrane protein A